MVLRIWGRWVRASRRGRLPAKGRLEKLGMVAERSGSSLVLFLMMCGMIAWSQWYAVHVNVPMYEARHAHAVTH